MSIYKFGMLYVARDASQQSVSANSRYGSKTVLMAPKHDFRGRDASYLAPPAQIRTGPIRAYGLYGAFFVKGASRHFGRPLHSILLFDPRRELLPSRPHISIAVARSGGQGRRFFSAAEGLSLTEASTAAGCRRSGEAGRDGFWLARWLIARGIEAHVIHSASVAVSRERKRAKTDRLDASDRPSWSGSYQQRNHSHCDASQRGIY